MSLPNQVFAIRTLKIGNLPIYRQKGAIRLSKDYDILILCMGIISITEWLLLLLSKFRRQKTYIWSHGWLGKDGIIKQIISRFYFSLADGVFVYNERSTRLMSDGGIPQENLYTIYNSLDYDKQLLLRKLIHPTPIYQMHFANENRNIVFIGRLTKVKRFDLLLDAVSLLRKRGEFVNVTFIGDGVERPYMEQRVKELGIDNHVWFYGACYDEKTNAEMIYNADLCVSPGNIGLTAMHVLMFGCPAITNDDFDHQMPEFEAIRKDKSGDFFKAGDSNSLAETISHWLSVHKNNREEVRQTCYKEIDEKWNPNIQIEIFKKVLLD